MRRALLAVALASLAAGCGSSSSPTSPTTTTTSTTTTSTTGTAVTSTARFDGVLDVGGANFYSFTVATGSVTANLASLSRPGSPAAVNTTVGLGVGTPKGEGCAVTQSMPVAPALVTQLTTSVAAGIHCVSIFDLGSMTTPLNYSIRLTYN